MKSDNLKRGDILPTFVAIGANAATGAGAGSGSGGGGSVSFGPSTALVGPTAVPGTALTAMRSDEGLAIDLTATYPWTGTHSFSVAPLFSTMTPGSVLFAGAAGVLSQDNAKLFWDDTQNYLGIGTATPTAALDVFGTGTTDVVIRSTTTALARLRLAAGVNTGQWLVSRNLPMANDLQFANAAYTDVNITLPDQGGLVIERGDLGIGADVILRRKAASVLALGAGDSIQSAAYASGVQGWNINDTGNAEFNNISARGELRSSIFTVGEVHATGGTFIVLNAGTLYAPVTSI